jgi:hypothetical protein
MEAQGQSFVLTDENTAAEHTFTNTPGGTVEQLADGMIVFEGELAADIPVAASADGQGRQLASVRLLAQIRLFDELPAGDEVGAVQGAVVALKDEPEATTGTYYAWGAGGWVQLMNSAVEPAVPFPVADGATNYIMFVFNYTARTNEPPGPVTYQLFIGETASTQQGSEPVTSPRTDSGINDVSLLGTGGLKAVATASGSTGPLSASIGFSAYATASGTLIILDPVNEQGSGFFTVFARINGEWVEVGKVQADGSGHYEFLAYPGLLQVGQSYAFKVIDEIGNPFELAQAVEIKTIKMDSIAMEPDVMVVAFNSEAGRSYQVISAESLTAQTWTATAIYYPVAGGEWAYGSEPFTAAGPSTTVRIPRNTSRGFFKIRKVD